MSELSGNNKIRKFFAEVAWYLLLAVVISSAFYAATKSSNILCNRVEISIDGGKENLAFITPDLVRNFLRGYKNPDSLIGLSLRDINASIVEERLLASPYIASANVFISLNGQININIEQKKPILRLMPDDALGYYLDATGKPIPLSEEHTARVCIASGRLPMRSKASDSLSNVIYRQLLIISDKIEENSLWQSQFTQIHRDGNGEYWLIPTVGNHKVLLGEAENLDEKFNNLLIFYRKGLSKVGWNKYRVINSKYTGQIVCEKW